MKTNVVKFQLRGWIIVKVFAPTLGKEVLIQSEDKLQVNMLAKFDRQFKKMLGKAKFKFFYAKVENGSLSLGEEAPAQDWPEHADELEAATPEVAHLILTLVDYEIPTEEIAKNWTQDEIEAAVKWASACHLAASDNVVKIPKRPEVLDRYNKSELKLEEESK